MSANREAPGQISERHEALGRKLGCNMPNVQIFSGRQKSHVYNNAIESITSLNSKSSVFPSDTVLLKVLYITQPLRLQKMDYATEKMGKGLRRAVHYVCRSAYEAQIFHHVKGKIHGLRAKPPLTCRKIRAILQETTYNFV